MMIVGLCVVVFFFLRCLCSRWVNWQPSLSICLSLFIMPSQFFRWSMFPLHDIFSHLLFPSCSWLPCCVFSFTFMFKTFLKLSPDLFLKCVLSISVCYLLVCFPVCLTSDFFCFLSISWFVLLCFLKIISSGISLLMSAFVQVAVLFVNVGMY